MIGGRKDVIEIETNQMPKEIGQLKSKLCKCSGTGPNDQI